ncbi:hypothetical protein [Bradyrhizobium elkanii]|nr:hypothetical protein [Bradyrhizobium elkanii]MBR1160245.1 hypothetical protein [Bradyrhizobium elkanii]
MAFAPGEPPEASVRAITFEMAANGADVVADKVSPASNAVPAALKWHAEN